MRTGRRSLHLIIRSSEDGSLQRSLTYDYVGHFRIILRVSRLFIFKLADEISNSAPS